MNICSFQPVEQTMPRPAASARNRSLPPRNGEKGRTPAGLERLKEHIRRLEGFGGTLAEANRRVLPFGLADIDARLPGGGLACGALHEVFAADAGIATAFCALLAGRLARGGDGGSVLWCERPWAMDAGALYGPALLPFGIDPARLILVRARRDADALWAMEEGLRCGRLAAVVGEVADMSLTASRRLQLAAGESGVTAFALRPRGTRPSPSAAATRWRLDAEVGAADGTDGTANDNRAFETGPAPPGLGAARWRAELFRCRGGGTADWMMEWNDETGDLSVAAPVRDGPAVPSAAGLAG
jgi:protein ImuA